MKSNKNVVLLLLIIILKTSFSQNAKQGMVTFRYENLPAYELGKEYSTYRVYITSIATDNVPLDKKRLMFTEDYLYPDKKNLTRVISKADGFEVANPDVETDFDIMFSYENIELIGKTQVTVTDPNTNATFYNYKFGFKFPYHLKVINRKTKALVCDTLINTVKELLYPADYKTDNLGNKIKYPGEVNQLALELALGNEEDSKMNFKSKGNLMPICVAEQKLVLKNLLIPYWSKPAFAYIRVKSKKPIFDLCDTANVLLDKIADSISANSKRESRLNWHTNKIRTQAARLESIWKEMLTDKFLAEFKPEDHKEKSQYIFITKKGIALSLLFQDKFDEALKIVDEITPESIKVFMGTYMRDESLDALGNLIKRERSLYSKHKAIYKFE